MLCVQSCPDREIETWEVYEVFTTQAGEGSLAQRLEESESKKWVGEEEAGASVPNTPESPAGTRP